MTATGAKPPPVPLGFHVTCSGCAARNICVTHNFYRTWKCPKCGFSWGAASEIDPMVTAYDGDTPVPVYRWHKKMRLGYVDCKHARKRERHPRTIGKMHEHCLRCGERKQ